MLLKVGYELTFTCEQPTTMLLALNIHPSRAADVLLPDRLVTEPELPVSPYYDTYGNIRSRIVVPAGETRLTANTFVSDTGAGDRANPDARQLPVHELPTHTLPYLLPSRYCEADLLGTFAWNTFGNTAPGWARVQAISDFVHNHITFDYQQACSTRTAWGAYQDKVGVCRDYTHLGIALCRAMNIPARYCTGYLGDIGTPPPWGVGDFAAWFEAYLDDRWYTFDPRHNVSRIGRVLIARGLDAADVAITHSFGPSQLTNFTVWTDEVEEAPELIRPQVPTLNRA